MVSPSPLWGWLSIAKGDVHVTEFGNGKILRYGLDGTFKGVFAVLEDTN